MILNDNTMNIYNNKMVVTVAVITYHSADTVLETLNSIVSQTYGPENIELIISDDGSKDHTVKVIEEWLSAHSSRFYRMIFFANKVNGGISKNCNIAWKAATSEWIKTIAGDDLLVENALTVYMEEIAKKPESTCLFSLVRKFNKYNEFDVVVDNMSKVFFAASAETQYRYLLIKNIIYAPTSFLNRRMLCEVGYADERYRLIEDIPLWLKICKAGYRFDLIESPLVKYRLSESISRSDKRIVNCDFSQEVNSFMTQEADELKMRGFYILSYLLSLDIKVKKLYEWMVVILLGNRKKYLFVARLISTIKLISPFSLIRFFGFKA